MAGSIEDDVVAEDDGEGKAVLYTFAYASKIFVVASLRNNNNNNNNFSLHLLRKSKMSFVCGSETGAGDACAPPWLLVWWPLMGFLWAPPTVWSVEFQWAGNAAYAQFVQPTIISTDAESESESVDCGKRAAREFIYPSRGYFIISPRQLYICISLMSQLYVYTIMAMPEVDKLLNN